MKTLGRLQALLSIGSPESVTDPTRQTRANIAVIGFGRIGGVIVDALTEETRASNLGCVCLPHVLSTRTADLDALEHVPPDRRFLIAGGTDDGSVEPTSGHGAASIREELSEILRVVGGGVAGGVDGFLFVTGLADGFGGGGVPVLADRVAEQYPGVPLYGLGTLPAGADPAAARTAVGALEAVQRVVDSVFLVDVAKWRNQIEASGHDHEPEIVAIRESVKRLGLLFCVGGTAATPGTGESDRRTDIVGETLSGGGLVTIGSAVERVKPPPGGESAGRLSRLVSWLRSRLSAEGSSPDVDNRFRDAAQRAATEQLSVACGLDTADDVLLILGGLESYLTDTSVAPARHWLAGRAAQWRIPVERSPTRTSEYVVAMVVAAGVTDVPRIDQLREAAEMAPAADYSEPTDKPVSAPQRDHASLSTQGEEPTEAFPPTPMEPAARPALMTDGAEPLSAPVADGRPAMEAFLMKRAPAPAHLPAGSVEPPDDPPRKPRAETSIEAEPTAEQPKDGTETTIAPEDAVDAPVEGLDIPDGSLHEGEAEGAEDARTASARHETLAVDAGGCDGAARADGIDAGPPDRRGEPVDEPAMDGRSPDSTLDAADADTPWFEADICRQMAAARHRTRGITNNITSFMAPTTAVEGIVDEFGTLESDQEIAGNVPHLHTEAGLERRFVEWFDRSGVDRVTEADCAIDSMILREAAIRETFRKFGNGTGM